MTAATPTAFANAGGFLPPSLPSLPSPAPSTASSRAAAGLPHPRSKPLVPGSRKEDYAREYVYRRLLHISRRYVKKHSIPDPQDLVSAYESFDEVCKDLDEVVDVLWFSGTPSLQVPYLLNVALAITEYLPAFPPSPRPTFALLKKLDHCFASLLYGHDIRTGKALPGFEGDTSKGMTRTDMVRCRSLADETRSLVAIKMSGESEVDTFLFPDELDVPAPISAAHKRKAEDDSESEILHSDRSTLSPKRQKAASPNSFSTETPEIKQEGNISPTQGGSLLISTETSGAGAGQFHWAVEDDSDEEHENERDDVMTGTIERPNQQMTPASGSETEAQTLDFSHFQEHAPDDEDNELHMSVAKVYEKTIIWLGRTLGETLVEE
ncbi:hypothetical protein PFICI_02130 [Pestalotiopsis fici W106-1]|uniref:Meiotic recombination protein DMC1 n=1 Tax=Pestalotiopsis fici (strain W106-1 / CGMCC3.15140) TaxID=1229662 RepID=W3XDH4_PESFW|nr:uncharacterized protein PFICI_02130 [Pestalotiopsis fici W106-1]ETS84105.1 hypothetical protein PFICI_02130 [Pestalotiopsis fici W106-1]